MLHNFLPFHCIRVYGKDATKFLQGQFTIDISSLMPGEARLSAYCSAKGKVQTTFWISQQTEGYWLIVPRSTSALQIDLLKRYSRFSKVTIEQSETQVYGLAYSPAMQAEAIRLMNSARCFIMEPHKDALPEDVWAAADIQDGFVLLDIALTDQFFPHYFNLVALNGIGFKKGCYLGQEIIARMEYRTEIKRHLHLATLNQDTSINLGEPLVNAEGSVVGTWVAGPCALGTAKSIGLAIAAANLHAPINPMGPQEVWTKGGSALTLTPVKQRSE